MKYNPLKNTKEKSFSVFENVKGLDLTSEKESNAGSGFEVCENIWLKDKKIVSRPALYTSKDHKIFNNAISDGWIYNYRLTDTEVEYSGKKGRIVELAMDYDESNFTVYVGIVFSDNSFVSVGNMHFGRTDDETFYIPKNILYYQGKSQGGGGIFAVIHLVNEENYSQKDYRIYEVDSSFTSWQPSSNYYIPTVYINGRGDAYEIAEENGAVYTPKPRELESFNMLNGSFYAYFTTDGYSSSFRLPFSKLASATVICRLYISKGQYIEWIVHSHQTSGSAMYNGQVITFNIDREKGVFNFISNYNGYPFPRMTSYDANNLRIYSAKQLDDAREKVLSCKFAENLGDKIILSGGNEKGEVYYSSYNRPLYFPLMVDNIVGTPADTVTGLCAFEDKVLVFKEKGIYAIKISDAVAINKTSLLADDSSVFYNSGKIKIDTLSLTLGSISKTRMAKFSKGVIWQETAGDIFMFYKNDLHKISSKISSMLKNISVSEKEKAFCSVWEEYYILFLNNKLVMINIEDIFNKKDNAKIFIWKLPEEYSVKGIFSMGKDISLVLELKDTGSCFVGSFSGDKDQIISINNSEISCFGRDIVSRFETKAFYPEKKANAIKIKEIYLDIDVNSCEMNFKTACGECGYHIESKYNSNIKLYPQLRCEDFIKISFESFSPFEILGLEMYYTL